MICNDFLKATILYAIFNESQSLTLKFSKKTQSETKYHILCHKKITQNSDCGTTHVQHALW